MPDNRPQPELQPEPQREKPRKSSLSLALITAALIIGLGGWGLTQLFDGGKRLQNDELWTAYSAGKQTAAQLAKQYGCSSKTIYRRLRSVQIRELRSAASRGAMKQALS